MQEPLLGEREGKLRRRTELHLNVVEMNPFIIAENHLGGFALEWKLEPTRRYHTSHDDSWYEGKGSR